MKDRQGNTLSFNQALKKSTTRLYNIILEFEIMILHWVGHIPIHPIRRFAYQFAGIAMGRGSTIHTGARFYDPSHIQIGQDSIIGEEAVLDGRDSLIIGDHVDIASNVMIYNSEHDIDSEDFRSINGPVKIEDYVFIGPRVIILPNVTIKKGAVVAAGAVVTKDVEPFTVVGGIPAQVIRERKLKTPSYRLGRARWFR